jgi:TPR repeat protein
MKPMAIAFRFLVAVLGAEEHGHADSAAPSAVPDAGHLTLPTDADASISSSGQCSDDGADPMGCEQLCDGGNASSCYQLGRLYFFGTGVGKDGARAASLFERACDGGAAAACTALGSLYVQGAGVSKDIVHAVKLADKGCAGGDELGCENADTIRSELPNLDVPRPLTGDEKIAEAKLPSLFSKCEANKAALTKLRLQAQSKPTAAVADRIEKLQPPFQNTLQDIRQTITEVTHDRGGRFRQMIAEMRRRCMPAVSTSVGREPRKCTAHSSPGICCLCGKRHGG